MDWSTASQYCYSLGAHLIIIEDYEQPSLPNYLRMRVDSQCYTCIILSVCLSVCLYVYSFVCVSSYSVQFITPSVCLSGATFSTHVFTVSHHSRVFSASVTTT